MVEGYSNKAIAQELFISENTVKYHIRNIFQKLEVQNRTEAVAHALREGLIRTDQNDS
jgi:DNA-binding NarL/FixJ family response regulator